MDVLRYIFLAFLVVTSIISVVFCIIHGKGILHKILVFSTCLLGIVTTICFGGEATLEYFDMGWRCTPFNVMLMLCFILIIIILCCCICELFVRFENANKVLSGCAYISIVAVTFIVLISTFLYFQALSWHDGLTIYNDQTIVYANDQHGGSCSWRYYTYINSFFHGIEITQDGWRGYQPFSS